MDRERGSQIPFGDLGIELVTDLDTGKQTLRPKRIRKTGVEKIKPPAPTRQWWERSGLMVFSKAAEGWRQGQAGLIAEDFGQNMEFGGTQMMDAETREPLRKTFAIAKRSSITALEVVGLMKAESLNLEIRMGARVNWVPTFVDSAINALAEVYGLNSFNTEALKRFAHQRKLPQFT